jgi:hypothetical protein
METWGPRFLKEIQMGYEKGKEFKIEYVYDFSVDGGAVGAITLTPKNVSGATLLEEGLIVTGVNVDILTAFAGTATPTVTLGNTADADGYLQNFYGSAGAVGSIRNGPIIGDLLWDNTNDCELVYRITSSAGTQNMLFTIGTQALTAGKCRISLKVYKPKA